MGITDPNCQCIHFPTWNRGTVHKFWQLSDGGSVHLDLHLNKSSVCVTWHPVGDHPGVSYDGLCLLPQLRQMLFPAAVARDAGAGDGSPVARWLTFEFGGLFVTKAVSVGTIHLVRTQAGTRVLAQSEHTVGSTRIRSEG